MLPEGFPMPPLGEGGSEFIRMLQGMLAGFREQKDEDFDVLGPLSETDRDEWLAIKHAHNILLNKAKALQAEKDMNDARRKVFWAKLESDTGIYDKNMKITDDCRLLIEKDKKACDGDCPACGEISPEDE